MASAVISAAHPHAHAKKHRPPTPTTPRRQVLAEWTRLLGRARTLRTRLPELAPSPAVDAVVRDWLAEGEAIAIVLAATTRD